MEGGEARRGEKGRERKRGAGRAGAGDAEAGGGGRGSGSDGEGREEGAVVALGPDGLHGRDVEARVRGDAIRLEQVLINLLRNGLDAMADKPQRRLEIRIEAADGHWRLSVLDCGGGIAPAALARVFDPLFTTKPVGAGLGLGLAISYGIVHEAGGRLQVENLPGGACFTLTLPRDLEPAC